jgi:serine/threonine protein kinase
MASKGIQHDFLDPPDDPAEYCGTLGHYRVVRELGKGGMGYVFLAEDSRLERQVALKVMNQKIASTPGSRKRFISEARAMASVHHDNVATIFEAGEHNGTPYMAMELLEGATLENFRERHGAPDYHRLIAFARDIARGLAAAHAQGIVHRDIKPANIWLDTKTNRIKILDFGLALAQTPVDQLSGRGAVIGTPGYLSPEQARSEPLDDRSDLYSTGVVLYELATGALPLKSKSVAGQLIAILAHDPLPLRERNDKIPQPLADLIHRLMAKEPRDRYSSAAELEQALERVEEECEKTSEVAQAISQLQLGLEQAVNKKKLDPATGIDVSMETQPNPFEALPDVLPAATPLPGVGTSGVHAAVPIGSAPYTPNVRSAASATKAKPAATSPNAKVIWIVAGIAAAILLLLIPAVVFFSASSAIARHQQQGATVVAPRPGDSGANPKPNTGPRGTTSPTPKQAAATPSKNKLPDPQPDKRQPDAATPNNPTAPVTTVSAKVVTELAGEGSIELVGPQIRNGSFEQGNVTKNQTKIEGWTLTTIGKDGGWGIVKNASRPQTRTFARAGKKSEIHLVSEPIDHPTQAGDVFRFGLNVGGEGQGMSDYQIILGFQGDSGLPARYQLAKLTDRSNWPANQRTLRYEYAADASVAGKRPFIEIRVSNVNRSRRNAMVDQIALTVRPAQPAQPAQPTPSTAETAVAADAATGMQPKADQASSSQREIAMVSSQPVSSTDPLVADPSITEKPVPQPSRPARQLTLKTSDEKGADTTVKRGGSSNDPLGEKPYLIVQTRNGRQIQHVYLRFPIDTLAGGNGQNSNRNRGARGTKDRLLPVETADLVLALGPAKRPVKATIRLYGLNQSVSDAWREVNLTWNKSLSAGSLEPLPILAEQEIGPQDRTLTISNQRLADFIAESNQQTVTFILTGGPTRDELVSFVSKEDGGQPPPTLILGLTE